jgi:hemolysin activation/secretion protein
VQPHGDIRDADVQTTTFALERDGRDDARVPRAGTRLRIEATESFTHGRTRPTASAASATQDASGSSVVVEGEWHRRLRGSAGLALEARAAGRFSSERLLTAWEEYPLGGAASLRGHDEEEFRVDRYALTRLEWRWFLGAPGQRVALFWDHAQMQSRRALLAGGDRLEQSAADGVGVGLRLPAAGGDVDLDYGLAPGRGFLDGKIHLRLVTAF